MPLRGDDHESARLWCDAATTGAISADGTLAHTKTGPAGWAGVSWSAGPSFVDWNRTRRAPAPPELVESFKQVVFACATLNANGVARIPLRLYAATRSGQHRPKCLTKSIGRRDDHRLRTASHLERWTKGAEQIDEVLEHPLLQTLNDVNPDWDHNALIRHAVFSLDVIGRAYWWMEPGRRATVANVWPLLAQYVLPIRDPVTSLVASYRYFDHDYQPDELVRMRHSSLRDPYALGLAPAEAAFAYVGLSDQFVSLQENLLTQGARPSLIVSNKDAAEPFGKEERARFQRDINASLTRGGTGMAWVVDGAIDVKTLTFPPADLAALQISENAVQRVANCFGVPLSLLKTEDVNLANAEAGHRQHAELAIDPRCILIASALTKWTREEGHRIERSLKARGDDFSLGWDRLFWAFDNPVKEDQERNARIHDMYVKNGVLTINDVRADLGYSAVDWGDEPWLNGSLSQPSDNADAGDGAPELPDAGDPNRSLTYDGFRSGGAHRTRASRIRRRRLALRENRLLAHSSGRSITARDQILKYDPNEPRDERGRWTEVLGSRHDSAKDDFKLGKHGTMERNGKESHHGVLSRWMSAHFKGYSAYKAPAVLMSKENHNETRRLYPTWRSKTTKQRGGKFDWSKVTEHQIRKLAEEMFDAAGVPAGIRKQYWAEFARMKRALRRSNSKQFHSPFVGTELMSKLKILTAETMREMYGAFYLKRDSIVEEPMPKLDRNKIPEGYWPLIPYAEFWGVGDDCWREELVDKAPTAVRKNLHAAVESFDLDPWLCGPENEAPKLSDEYVAFTNMLMASDSAG